MSNFGFRSQVNLDGSPHDLPFDLYRELREKLDRNPPDKDWRALVRAVEDRYYIGYENALAGLTLAQNLL